MHSRLTFAGLRQTSVPPPGVSSALVPPGPVAMEKRPAPPPTRQTGLGGFCTCPCCPPKHGDLSEAKTGAPFCSGQSQQQVPLRSLDRAPLNCRRFGGGEGETQVRDTIFARAVRFLSLNILPVPLPVSSHSSHKALLWAHLFRGRLPSAEPPPLTPAPRQVPASPAARTWPRGNGRASPLGGPLEVEPRLSPP